MSVVLDSHSARTQLRRPFDGMNVRSLTRIVTFAELSGIGLEDVETAATALRHKADARTDDPEGALWALADLALNRGRPSEAREAVEATRDFGEPNWVLATHVLNTMLGEGDSAAALNAVRIIRRTTAGPPARGAAVVDRNMALCALGLWYAQRREWIEARRVLVRMGEQGPQEQILPALAPADVCASLLETVLAVGQGRPDARKALVRADSLMRAGWFPLTLMNLILARLWEAEGDVAQALAAVRRYMYDDPDGGAYLATRLRTEGRLAALAGDRDGAVRAYTHYLALVNQPEPRVQPLVTQVRDEVARLVGEQPPRN